MAKNNGEQFNFRMSDAEGEKLREMAERMGMTQGAVMRLLIRNAVIESTPCVVVRLNPTDRVPGVKL